MSKTLIINGHEIELTDLEQEMFDKYTVKESTNDPDEPRAHRVFLEVGVQKFMLRSTTESDEHGDWMRAMLAKALANVVLSTMHSKMELPFK